MKKIFYRDFTVYSLKQLLSKKIGRFIDFEKSEIKMNIKFEFLSQKRVFQVPFCKILLQKIFFRLLAIFGRQDFSRTDYFDEKIFLKQNFTKGYLKDAFSTEEFEFNIHFYLGFFNILETTNFHAQKLFEGV